MRTPILRNGELELRQVDSAIFSSRTLDITWPVAEGPDGLDAAVDRVCAEASAALRRRGQRADPVRPRARRARAPIPSLLAVGSVHHHLVREGTRLQTGLVLESGEPREVHHFATLIGFGASAINPYLMFESLAELVEDGRVPGVDDVAVAETNVVKGIAKGLLKTISKMGISTIQSYNGAQIFEAVGLGKGLIDRAFVGTASRIGGIEIDVLAAETLQKHACVGGVESDTCCRSAASTRGAARASTTCGTRRRSRSCSTSVRHGGKPTYEEYARLVNEDAAAHAARCAGCCASRSCPRTSGCRWTRSSPPRRSSALRRRRCRSARSRARRTRRSRDRDEPHRRQVERTRGAGRTSPATRATPTATRAARRSSRSPRAASA